MNHHVLRQMGLLMLLFTMISNGFEGRTWIDEDGNATNLINYNPDPNGEPWLAGGLIEPSAEKREWLDQKSEITLNNETRNRTLPKEVILLNNEEFIPVFNQIGGSCGQASGVAYAYSYQLNVLKGVKGTNENARAYGYTHNFLNRGNNSKGSWYWDGWEILSKHGAPDVETFHGSPNGGLQGTRWMNGADRWHKANDNKVVKYEKITINSMNDIQKIKSWMYDLNGTDPHIKGGCVLFAANGGSADGKSTVSSGTHAGEALCNTLSGEPMNHAMTFAGYSDEVEGGSLLLLNSWGTSFGTNGYVWVPYTNIVNGGLFKNEVWGVTVSLHKPKFEIRASITHIKRDDVCLNTGFSPDKNSVATIQKNYGRAFNYSGGFWPMEGNSGSNTIEVSLDVSEFFDKLESDTATFFLQCKTTGTLTIKDVTLIDYSSGKSVEYPAKSNIVTVTDTASIAIDYISAIPRYSIFASVLGNGNITPVGNSLVDSSKNQKYEIIPDKWHVVDSIIVDGVNIGAVTSYEFANVTQDHTIKVYFGWDSNTKTIYNISSSSSPNGTVVPSGVVKVEEGDSKAVTISPTIWYNIDSVLIDGVNRGPLVFVDFVSMYSNHTIEPFYSLKPYDNMFYGLWSSNKVYGLNKTDTVIHKDHLWESQYWTKGNEPGVHDVWRDLGKANLKQNESTNIAFMEYRSNMRHEDTLIITSKTIKGTDTTVTTIDTITSKVSIVDLEYASNKQVAKIIQNGKAFYAPVPGSYTISMYDIKGRLLNSKKVDVEKIGIYQTPMMLGCVASGVYVYKVVSVQGTAILKCSK